MTTVGYGPMLNHVCGDMQCFTFHMRRLDFPEHLGTKSLVQA